MRAVVGAGLALGLVLSFSASPANAAIGEVRIGSKNFAGAEVLSQVYGQALAAKGAQVTFLPDVGPTEATFDQLGQGTFDGYGEYQGTLLEFLGGEPSNNSAETHTALEATLDAYGFVVSQPGPAVDVNGFYVMRKTATKYKLTTVSDLKKVADRAHVRRAAGVPRAAAVSRQLLTAALRPAIPEGRSSSTPVARRRAAR